MARLTFPLILTQSFSSLVCLLSVVVEDVALQVELTEVAAEAQEEINKAVSDSQDEVVKVTPGIQVDVNKTVSYPQVDVHNAVSYPQVDEIKAVSYPQVDVNNAAVDPKIEAAIVVPDLLQIKVTQVASDPQIKINEIVKIKMSRSRTPSPLNLVTKGETYSVSITEVSSSSKTRSVPNDELVSSSTIDTNFIKNEEPSVAISIPLSIDLSTSISSEKWGGRQSKRTPTPPNSLPLLLKSVDVRAAECSSKDSAMSSESFSSSSHQKGFYSPSLSHSPMEVKRPKQQVTVPSPLKEKMERYELKMRHVRESIRLKRLQQGLTCQQCGRSYCRPYNLKRHIEYECGKAPQFPCMYCTYRARHKHDLKKHVTFKHSKFFDHFQAVQDQIESQKLNQITNSQKQNQVSTKQNLSDVKQKIRDQVNSRQKQNAAMSDEVRNNLSEQSGMFGSDFYKILQQNFMRLSQSDDNPAVSRPYSCESDADTRGNSSSGRSEVGLRIRTAASINMESPDHLGERERDSGIHSTGTSPDAGMERDESYSQSSSNGDNYNAAEDHSTDEESNDGLTIDEEERATSSSEGNSTGQASSSLEGNLLNIFNPMTFNPYLAAFGAQHFNNNELMKKILLENPLLFQENLKNALIFLNQFNPALASGFPV